MKELDDKINESKKETVPNVSQESSNGGTAQLVDNRSTVAVQRKLQDSMSASSENNSNPIQRNNTGLPDNLKSGIENLSGHSMDDVKVHYNSSKPAQLQAHAYAQGTDIHLASGQEKHLPHEAWHVVQQKQGRVKPTKQLKSKVNVNDDIGLEKEADVMGKRSVDSVNQGNTVSSINKSTMQDSGTVQRFIYENRDNPNPVTQPNAFPAGYRDQQVVNNNQQIQSEVALNAEIRTPNLQIDDFELSIIVHDLWQTFGTDAANHIDTFLIKQIFKDLHKRNGDYNFDFTLFKRYLRIYLDTRTEGLKNNAGGNAVQLILGRFMPNVRNTANDTNEWWFRGPGSYIQLAGNNNAMYFDLGYKWDQLTNSTKHDIDNDSLFHIFNTYVLDYAVRNAIQIKFVDHPDEVAGSSLQKEWLYLQERHHYMSLTADGDGQYTATL